MTAARTLVHQATKLLKWAIAAQLAATVLGVGVDIAFESTIPSPLREYSAKQLARPWSMVDMCIGAWSFLTVLSGVGVWLSVRQAKWLYAVASVGNLVLAPFSTATIAAAAATPLYQGSMIANGVALGSLILVEMVGSDIDVSSRAPSA